MALVCRGEKFLSVPEAAARIGVTRLTVHRWLNGTRGAPRGVSLDEVIRDTRTNQAYLSEAVVRRLLQAVRGSVTRAPKRKGATRRRTR